MEKPIVTLDPGHGGHDPGAINKKFNVRESERALDVCLRAEELLKPFVKVVMTRRTDIFVPLHERPKIANRAKSDRFVSYHFNSGSSPNTKPSWEIFTTPGQNNSDTMATDIGEAHKHLFPNQTGRVDMKDGDLDKEAQFAVIRGTLCPSCLVEGEFIHTDHGAKSILNPNHQHNRAVAVAEGVLKNLGVKHPPFTKPGTSKPGEMPLTLDQRLNALTKRVEQLEQNAE